MKDVNLMPDEFEDYPGDYEKICYDIQLKDGRVIENCYPNAGHFIELKTSHDYNGDLVSKFRKAKNPSF